MNEYPKAIYADGKTDGECLVVFSADEEKEADKKGFIPIGEQPAKKRGRPAKVKE